MIDHTLLCPGRLRATANMLHALPFVSSSLLADQEGAFVTSYGQLGEIFKEIRRDHVTKPEPVAHACCPRTSEAEAGGLM